MNHHTYSLFVKVLSWVLLLGSFGLLCLSAGCSGKGGDQGEEIKKRRKEKSGLSFIRTDDCLNCHSIEDKSVGPSYVKVAQKYEADYSTVNHLADKIIEGGGGIWGGGQMTEHPFLKKEDAKKIVRWVLSLDDSTVHTNPMVETPSLMLSQAFKLDPDENKRKHGLLIKAYSLEKLPAPVGDDLPEIPQHLTPEYTGIVPTLHFTRPGSFEPLKGNFLLQATGFIHIKDKTKYFFKQVRAGKGSVYIDGAKVISENEWDRETAIHLLPGTYPVKVEYLVEEGKKALSLQWISREDEYYRVIPEEVFTYN